MKTISMMVITLTCLVWFTAASAMDVKFQWDPNTESDLAGYKIYYGTDDLSNPLQQDVAKQTVATISGLDPAQNYAFAVVAYNTSGLESSYSNVVNVLESVLPVVSITSPSNNAKVSNTVSIAASASDNVGVTKVEFYLDGVLKVTQAAGPYLYSWDALAVAAGTHTIIAKAYDAAGNVGVSTVSVNVVNDATPPVITNIAPAQGSSVSGVIKVSADATDNVGVTLVEFYANGTLLFAGNVPPFSFNWNTTSVVNGSYTLTVKAYDNAGNIGQSSNISLTVFNDTTAPTVTNFVIPATASSTTVTISSLTATDNAAVTGYMVTESDTKPAAGASGWTASAPTTFTFSAAGSKAAYAWAKDAAGNVSASRTASLNITLPDTTLPTVAFNTPANGATVSGSVTVTATASDNIGVARVELYINGLLTTTDSASPFSFTWNTTSLANGSYTLKVLAFDSASNSAASELTVTVMNSTTMHKKRTGDLNGDGKIDLADAMLALRKSVGLTTQKTNAKVAAAVTDEDLDGDVAPLDTSGAPHGDGKIDSADALLILKKAIGLVKW